VSPRTRVVLAISGASGAALGVRIAERLVASPACETHLIVSPAAELTLRHEVGTGALERLRSVVAQVHRHDNLAAPLASGSYQTGGMIIAPCSIRSLSAIAYGQLSDLLVRAADVHLKERRRLVLMVRETPLHLGHLRAMTLAAEMGAMIMPPVPAFYRRPQSVAELVDHLAARAINLLDLEACRQEIGEWDGVVAG
jgi:4-hydroxy-3-polyprenylbenzoate decarboxylase